MSHFIVTYDGRFNVPIDSLNNNHWLTIRIKSIISSIMKEFDQIGPDCVENITYDVATDTIKIICKNINKKILHISKAIDIACAYCVKYYTVVESNPVKKDEWVYLELKNSVFINNNIPLIRLKMH